MDEHKKCNAAQKERQVICDFRMHVTGTYQPNTELKQGRQTQKHFCQTMQLDTCKSSRPGICSVALT